jgi:hypothetical protein
VPVRCPPLLIAVAACGGGTPPRADPDPHPAPDLAAPIGPDAHPDGVGELPMSEVDAHMDDVRAAIRACAARTRYEGKVSVRVTIQPSGAATAVLEPNTGDAEIDRCMVAAFDGVTFPTSQRGQRFVFSYTF